MANLKSTPILLKQLKRLQRFTPSIFSTLDLSKQILYTVRMKNNTIQEQIVELSKQAMKARGIQQLHIINLQLNELRKKLALSK